MIRRLSGEIVEIFDESIAVRTGAGLCYEALVGTYALPELQALMDAREPVELHTHHYLEGNAASGQSLIPRLVGFLTPAERDFFLRFSKVPGISTRSGIRAMGLPPERIAAAIVARDMGTLTRLQGIGKKKAEQIISHLADELAETGLLAGAQEDARPQAVPASQASEVMAILVGQLGLRTPDAEELIERALSAKGADAQVPVILEEVFRIRR
ncbi:MAG: Holliday junction branch migration protein RuvA [Nitrospinota bacterium]